MEILIPQKWTTRQVKHASAKAAEFRRNPYTTGYANLDDMVALKKAVTLCDSHARKFEPRKAHYSAHPEKRLRRVVSNCDVCKQWGLGFLFLNGEQALEERKKLEKFKRALEYATVVSA